MQLLQVRCQLGTQHEATLWQGQAQIIVVSLKNITVESDSVFLTACPALHCP